MDPERLEEPVLPKDTSEEQVQDIIELSIKNPYREKLSFSCNVSVNDTLLDLKEHLQTVYFGNPKPAEQRLIFAGKIYDDSTKISEILSKDNSDELRICHLIVSSQLSSTSMMGNESPAATSTACASADLTTSTTATPGQLNGTPSIAIANERPSLSDSRDDTTRPSNYVHTPDNHHSHSHNHSHIPNSSSQGQGTTSFQQQQQIYLQNLYQQQVLLQRQFLNAMGSNNNTLGEQARTTSVANMNIGSTEGGLSQTYQFPNPSPTVENYLGSNFMDATTTIPQMLGTSFGGLSPAAFAVEMQMREIADPATSIAAQQSDCVDDSISGAESQPLASENEAAKDEAQSKTGEDEQNTTAVDPLERLEKAYERLVRTMVLSQQLQALSNPILFTPQPMLSYHDYLRNYPYQRRANTQHAGQRGGNDSNVQSPNNNINNVPQASVTEDTQDPVQNNQNNIDAAAAQNLRPVNVVMQRVFAINIGLIMKLAFFVYIVAGDASYSRIGWVVASAFLYYIYEVGFFTYMFGRELSFTSLLDRFGQSRLVQIPPRDSHPGLATDMTVLAKTFLFSLVPSWHPVRYPEEVSTEQQEQN